MNGQIPINDNMPDDLKAAINYLNKNNISLDDNFDEEDEEEIYEEDIEDADLDFGDPSSDDDDDFEEDEEAQVDVSELNTMF